MYTVRDESARFSPQREHALDAVQVVVPSQGQIPQPRLQKRKVHLRAGEVGERASRWSK
jgi:hypothetical protein